MWKVKLDCYQGDRKRGEDTRKQKMRVKGMRRMKQAEKV